MTCESGEIPVSHMDRAGKAAGRSAMLYFLDSGIFLLAGNYMGQLEWIS
jgi:hypothetical protein